jgi:uncharacterized protein (DUF1330 family)
MSAYAVFIREKTVDQAELETYWKKVRPTFEGHPVKILVSYGNYEVLEGEPVEGIVIAEFPTFEAAKTWYDSPAYREVREHRFRGAIYRAMIAEGL